jgi:large subunit ribosomal protein L31
MQQRLFTRIGDAKVRMAGAKSIAPLATTMAAGTSSAASERSAASISRHRRANIALAARFAYKPGLLGKTPNTGCVMKKGIHPDYHFVNVVLNDGTTYRTRTTWGEPDARLTLDIDPSTHPAWTGGQQNLIDRGGRLSRFNKKFKDFVKS